MLRQTTFTEGKITITVRQELGSDLFDEDIVLYNLGDTVKGHPLMRVNKFIKAVIRSTVKGKLPFVWPSSVTDVTNIPAAYEGWRALPRELLKKWDDELDAVNESGDPDLHPMDVPPGEASLPT